jgi:hypothetical protein
MTIPNFLSDLHHKLDRCCSADKAWLLDALTRYADTGEEPQPNKFGAIYMLELFAELKDTIDKEQRIAKTRAANGKTGGRPPKNQMDNGKNHMDISSEPYGYNPKKHDNHMVCLVLPEPIAEQPTNDNTSNILAGLGAFGL